MGISGLLPLLTSKKIRIAEFSGKTIAVDAYCWLHKGAAVFWEDVVLREDFRRCVGLCRKNLDILAQTNVTPIVVLDGRKLVEKIVNDKRRSEREENIKRGMQLRKDKHFDEALHLLTKGATVSTQLALELVECCREKGVKYIVAPFEADAQIAFMQKNGLVDLAISEDSDLLVYGCDQVIYKFKSDGTGDLVNGESLRKLLKFKKSEFCLEKFQIRCILSGCDHLESLKGIGIKRAKIIVEIAGHKELEWILRNIGTLVKLPYIHASESYIAAFKRTIGIFQHHPVMDPVKKKVI